MYQGTTAAPRAGRTTSSARRPSTFLCPSDPNTKVQIIGGCLISPLLPWASPFPLDTGGTNYVFNGGPGNSWTFHAELTATRRTSRGTGAGRSARTASGRCWRSPTGRRTRSCSGRSCGWTTRTTCPPGTGRAASRPGWSGTPPTSRSRPAGGINAKWPCKGPTITVATGACGPPRAAALQSMHTGGANVAMCDGSVRFLSQNTAQNVLDAAATREGGEVLPLN